MRLWILPPLGVLLAISPAWAAWTVIPAASVKEEFTDNLFVSSDNKASSFITTFSPGIVLQQGSERGVAGGGARLNLVDYSHDSSLKSIEQRYYGFLQYRINPLLTAGVNAAFGYESRPDREVELTGLVLTRSSKRQEYAGTLEQLFTESTTGTLAYAYADTRYVGDASSDMASHTASASILHDLEAWVPRTKLKAGAGFFQALYRDATIANFAANVGVHHALHELWSADLEIGGRYTSSTFNVSRWRADSGFMSFEQESDSVGWVGSAAITYSGEVTGAALRFSRNLLTSTGRNGAAESTVVAISASRRITSAFSTSLTCGFYENFSKAGEFAPDEIDQLTLRINPRLRYEFTPDLNVDLSYEYAVLRNRQSDTRSDQNKVFLMLSFQYPIAE